MTALHCAAASGWKAAMELLLQRGARIEAKPIVRA